jgi:hypothetical protein
VCWFGLECHTLALCEACEHTLPIYSNHSTVQSGRLFHPFSSLDSISIYVFLWSHFRRRTIFIQEVSVDQIEENQYRSWYFVPFAQGTHYGSHLAYVRFVLQAESGSSSRRQHAVSNTLTIVSGVIPRPFSPVYFRVDFVAFRGSFILPCHHFLSSFPLAVAES